MDAFQLCSSFYGTYVEYLVVAVAHDRGTGVLITLAFVGPKTIHSLRPVTGPYMRLRKT